jgi:hypothetical protein
MVQTPASKKSKNTNCSGCEDAQTSKKNSKPVQKPVSKQKNMVNSMGFKSSSSATMAKPLQKAQTKIVVKCNCGFPNSLFIRGEGIAELNWNKGTPMRNVKADEWVWETDRPFSKGQFKVLINDKVYEVGENHKVECGTQCTCNPRF